jgi:beta-1,2-mannobiose phosphorylase / 1,2-beta-oligomannan phosphorylase
MSLTSPPSSAPLVSKTIRAVPAKPVRLERYAGNPILSPRPGNTWETLVTTNPGAWYDEESREVKLLYRAAGDDKEHLIHLGLAVSSDGYTFRRTSDQPVLSPGSLGLDGGCVEDPRIVKIDGWYYVTYAARPFPPGQYWLKSPDKVAPELPSDAPWSLRTNATATYLALTKDFKNWIRVGRMTDPSVDDRDVYIFPEKINGKFYMLHRPMNWAGPEYGTEYPAMWISEAEDLLCWKNPRLLAKAEYGWENRKIGGNTPPIRTRLGWMTLYHAVGTDKLYRLGAMILDEKDPSVVRYRTREWILQPEQAFELEGFYPGVCFPCGKVVIDGTLFVYYGGADKYVGLATCKLESLLSYLEACPV